MATATKSENQTANSQEVFSFTVLLSASNLDDALERLEAHFYGTDACDATLGVHAGHLYIAFDRAAASLEEAIVSAIKQLEASGAAIEIVRVIPPGEEIIESVNAWLRVRRQLLSNLPEPAKQTLDQYLDRILDLLLKMDKDSAARLLHSLGK